MEAQRGELSCPGSQSSRLPRQVPKSYKSSYVIQHLFAYWPGSLCAVHRAQRAGADSQDGPDLTQPTVCWGTAYKHPKCDNRGPLRKGFALAIAPLDTAMAASPQSSSYYCLCHLPLAVTVDNNLSHAYPSASGIPEHLCCPMPACITTRPSPSVENHPGSGS